ncbi:lysylphosphatidylglycerol synthase transmembrane domain-containing protein [Eudoraea chungangensis]|uniref:lysylphosphatidylglycerol synthase transmembrane domain-containing protein n=1 Tax=Eudoraea chungangensis TaxID=1481905 RepID=UPI0023ECEF94
MENLRKKGITFLKIIFSVILLYFVFNKIALKEVFELIKTANPYFLILAVLFFVGSKVFAALRLNLFIHALDIPLSHRSNFKLYLLGMFYNLFLPGGIGGDAYKGYVLKKEFQLKTKRIVSILLLDRLSGLLLIFQFACLFSLFLKQAIFDNFQVVLIAALLISLVVFWFINKKYFSYVYSVFWKAVGYSFLVQGTQIISVIFILKSLSIAANSLAYLFIFLVSSIVSVLPLTIGGIGSREVVFYYGALWLGLEENASISISMLFFIITAFVSLLGIVYHFKKPSLLVAK